MKLQLVMQLGTLGLFLLASHDRDAFAAPLLLEYRFNETGNVANNTGTSVAAPQLTLQNSTGVPTDLHTVSGGGVSGLSGDSAFDNSASVGMGDPGPGGRALHTQVNGTTASDYDSVDALSSFTISGWFNTGTVVNNNARFAENRDASNNGWLLYAGAAGRLYMQIDGVAAVQAPSASWSETNQWVFFAVSYDGSLTSNNLQFYKGTTSSPVAAVGSALTLNAGPVNGDTGFFVVGNSTTQGSGFIRPVDGLLDNIRLQGGSGNTGVATLAELEAFRQVDVIPEPSTMLLCIAGLGMVMWRAKNR